MKKTSSIFVLIFCFISCIYKVSEKEILHPATNSSKLIIQHDSIKYRYNIINSDTIRGYFILNKSFSRKLKRNCDSINKKDIIDLFRSNYYLTQSQMSIGMEKYIELQSFRIVYVDSNITLGFFVDQNCKFYGEFHLQEKTFITPIVSYIDSNWDRLRYRFSEIDFFGDYEFNHQTTLETP
ncbi:MAG: hypothetical protein KG003_12525 [Bacteroidetes bacterium]|nr:hypothetical protein [Bacteroidota bacterium]